MLATPAPTAGAAKAREAAAVPEMEDSSKRSAADEAGSTKEQQQQQGQDEEQKIPRRDDAEEEKEHKKEEEEQEQPFLHVGTEDLATRDDGEIAERAAAFRAGRHASSSSSRSSITSSFGSKRGSMRERIRSLSVKSRAPLEDQLLVYVVLPTEVHRLTTITAPLSVFARRCEVHTVAAQDTIRNTAHRVDPIVQPEFTFADAPLDADMVVVIGSVRGAVRRWLRRFAEEPVIVKIKGAYMTRYRDNFQTKTKMHMSSRTDLDASLDLLDILYREAAGNSSFTTAAASPPSSAMESPPPSAATANASIPDTPTSVGASIGDLAARDRDEDEAETDTAEEEDDDDDEEGIPRLLSCSSSASLEAVYHEENVQPEALLEASRKRREEQQQETGATADALLERLVPTFAAPPAPAAHSRKDSSPETVISDALSDISSSDGPPGDRIAEELGFYRHYFGTDPQRTRLGAKDKFVLWTLRMRAIVRERIIAVVLYNGVDELGVSAVLDTWGSVSGVRLVLLSASKYEKADPETPGPIVHTPVIRSANGLRFREVRPLSSFARSPNAIASLHACLLPPAGAGVRGAPTANFVRRRFAKIAGEDHVRCEFWDQTSLTATEAYTHQMNSITENYSSAAARSVARKLALGAK